MGRKKKQQVKTTPEVGETSEEKQQELTAAMEDWSVKDNPDKVYTNRDEDDGKWSQLEKPLISHLSFRSEDQLDSENAAMEDWSVKDNPDKVYTNRDEDDSFEWYGKWSQLEKPLISHLSFRSEEQLDSAGAQPPPEKEAADVSILVPLCGKLKLSENLYDAGFKNITNLDLSKDVICDMLKRNVRVRPEMKWRVMDITNMQFANETFDAVVDKGGLDSLMKAGLSLGSPYLFQVKKVLKAGGKYVCLTLAEPLVLDVLFPMFRFGWEMSLYAIGQEASSKDSKLQTFMVVAEKMGSPAVYAISSFVEQHFFEPNSKQARDLYEVLRGENKIRLEYADDADILYSPEDLLLGALGNLSQLVPGRRVRLSLRGVEGFAYNCVLLDAEEDSGPFILIPYAVFLVPQNRAHEWIFTSEEGQWNIVGRSKASRLLVILLDSINSRLSMDYIQMDLSPSVKQLEPGDCDEGFETPYLIAADRMTKQEIVYQGSSVMNGPIIVEDVIYQDIADDEADYKGCTFRRLIFKRNENLVQSQALLSIKESNRISTDVGKDKEQQAPKPKKKGKQRKSDSQSSRSLVSSGEVKVVHNHLVSGYHSGIVLGIQLISSYLKVSTSTRGLVKTVVIGLGGGLLPMFMKNHLPSLKIEVVEIDRKVLNVARDYFGFSDDESLKVHIADGRRFVKEKADGNSSCKIDILVVDVDSSDPSSALTSPAADFVDESFLLTVKDSLSEQGLFIINLYSRSSSAKDVVYSRVKKVFSCILSLKIQADINVVLFALKKTDSPINEDQLSEACKEFAKSLEHEKKWIKKEVGLSKSIELLD